MRIVINEGQSGSLVAFFDVLEKNEVGVGELDSRSRSITRWLPS